MDLKFFFRVDEGLKSVGLKIQRQPRCEKVAPIEGVEPPKVLLRCLPEMGCFLPKRMNSCGKSCEATMVSVGCTEEPI